MSEVRGTDLLQRNMGKRLGMTGIFHVVMMVTYCINLSKLCTEIQILQYVNYTSVNIPLKDQRSGVNEVGNTGNFETGWLVCLFRGLFAVL